MKPCLKWSLLALLALLLLPLALAGALLATTAGNQWLLQQVPGLEVKRFEGLLLGRWSAEYVHWQDGDVSVQLQQPDMTIQLSCLLERRLCLRQLQVQQLAVDLPDSAGQQSERTAIELPTIDLPLALELQQLELASLRLNGQQLMRDVSLQAQLVDGELSVQQLQLAYQEHGLTLSGQLQLEQDWPLQLVIDYAGSVQQLGQQQARLQISGTVRQLQLAAELQGALTGHMQARLEPLHHPLDASLEFGLQADYGSLTGQAQLQVGDSISWDARLQAKNFNPAYLLAQLPGQISGQLQSKGSFADKLQLQALVQLDGQLLDQALAVDFALHGQDRHWQLSELQASLGAASLGGAISLQQKLAGNLQLHLPQLGEFLPEADGALQLQLQLSGDLEQPVASLQMTGRELAYQAQQIGLLELQFAGDPQQQQLAVQLDGPLRASAELRGRSDLQQLAWQGELTRLSTGLDEQQINLVAPVQIDYLHEKHLYLSAHCLLSNENARLCASKQLTILPSLDLAYQLQNFPLYALQPWLAPQMQLHGSLSGEISLQQQQQLQAIVELDAGQGHLLYVEQGHEYNLGWRQLQLQLLLDEDDVNGKLLLKGRDTGKLQLDLALDPHSEDKHLAGSFLLQQLDLQPLQAMLPMVEQIRGNIEGAGKISGPLLQPQVDGAITLKQGLLSGQQLPMELRQLWLDVRFSQNRASLDGGWHSGKQGTATISGQVDWQQQLQVAVSFNGQQLPVLVAPYADLLLDADLQLGLGERGLLLSGLLQVPSGQIKVPELPAQAVRVSSDAQVVGQEEKDSSLPLALDLQIRVGQERLYFTGFGLSALVVGDMHMSDSLNGRGVLELKEGRYRAYGQRLQLRRARLVFSGPITQPYIDIEAVRVTGDVTAGLRLSGLAEQPQTEIFSQPAMSQEQALSWLLLGRPLHGGNDDGNMMGQAALALGMLGTTPIANRMADAFGIKEFQLDTEGSGMETSVMASGRVTDKLTVGYGVGVFQPGGIISLRYELTRRLYVEAASSLANSLDIFYRRSF